MPRLRGVVLELSSQLDDVRVHGSRLDVGLIAPHALEQLLSRHNTTRATRERLEQIELLGPERDGRTPARHRATRQVNLHVTE